MIFVFDTKPEVFKMKPKMIYVGKRENKQWQCFLLPPFFSVFLQELIYLLYLSLLLGDFIFTAKPWKSQLLTLHREDTNLTISCSTNDTNAVVYLQRQTHSINATHKMFGERLKRVKQKFILTEVKMHDMGYYDCIARKGKREIKLRLGRFWVSPGMNL